jgi:hypothetical protein
MRRLADTRRVMAMMILKPSSGPICETVLGVRYRLPRYYLSTWSAKPTWVQYLSVPILQVLIWPILLRYLNGVSEVIMCVHLILNVYYLAAQEARTGCTARDWPRDPKKQPGYSRRYTTKPPNKAVLELHSGLQKAEISVLVQARTGQIRLTKFLYNCKVPGILSAQCRCRAGKKRHGTCHSIA